MTRDAAAGEIIEIARLPRISDEHFEKIMGALAAARDAATKTDDLLEACAETVEESVFSRADSAAPDCKTCGACCAYFHRVPVLVTDATPRSLTWEVVDDEDSCGEGLRWMRREAQSGLCVAFDGEIGREARCLIYELRPSSCRKFEAGSDRCRAVRRAYGLEPQLSAAERDELARAMEQAGSRGAGEDALKESVHHPGGRSDKSELLRDMIRFNHQKLTEILIETERLLGFFRQNDMHRAAAKAGRALRFIERDARGVAGLASRLLKDSDDGGREMRRLESSGRELLRAGVASQRAVDLASRRLSELGQIAYQGSGMRGAMLERALDWQG